MALKFKNRGENPRKKILVYGLDGSGKSTFAYNYCKRNGLNPVVVDVDDTNFTPSPILDLNFGNDLTTYKTLKDAIQEIGKTDDFDTIIIDGVTSLLEMLVSKSKGMSAYSDRSKRWNDILFKLDATKKNIIFIGQIDMEMLFTDDYQPSKAVIKVNSLVNEKYKCFVDAQGNYTYEVKKMRTLDQIEAEASRPQKEEIDPPSIHEKRAEKGANNMDNAIEIAQSIVAELPANNRVLVFAKVKVKDLVDRGILSEAECPRVIAELERLL